MITAVVPAAGEGRRLGVDGPKALAPLLGRSLLAHVLDAVAAFVDQLVLVLRPGDEDLFAAELDRIQWSKPATMVVQPVPTGSAEAVAIGVAASSEACLVIWADQAGVSPTTVDSVVRQLRVPAPPLVLPLIELSTPYVWVDLGEDGGVMKVHRQRDGDVSPARGYADLGIFGLPRDDALICIREEFTPRQEGDRERDFVYVLPRLAARCGVHILPIADETQAVAVNTSEELERASAVLGGRS